MCSAEPGSFELLTGRNLSFRQIKAYRCWARSGDWVPLTLCPCLFRGVLWLGETLGLRPVTSCDLQIGVLVQILTGGGECLFSVGCVR